MKDYSFVKNIQASQLPGVEIRRIPGIEKLESPDGKLYGVTYFFDGGHGFMKVRFTSRSAAFRELYTVDLFDRRQQPIAGLVIRDDISPDDFLKALTDMLKVLEYRGAGVASEKATAKTETLHESTKIAGVEKLRAETLGKNPKYSELDLLFSGGRAKGWKGTLMKWIGMIGGGIYILMMVFSAGMVLYGIYMFLSTSIRNWYQNKYASTTLEKKVSHGLFGEQKKNEPAFAIYNNVVQLVKHVLAGKARAVILYGPPGMSKTYIVRRTLHFEGLQPRSDYEIIKGTALGSGEFYELLYRNRHKILILDDFDQPLNNPETVNLLKAVTDSYSARVVAMPRETTVGSEGGQTVYNAPEKFEFLGRIILITNLGRDKIDRALLSRAPAVEINFDVKKMIEALAAMMKFMHPEIPIAMKREVYDFVLQLYQKDKHIEINFRSFQSAVEVRYALPDHWQELTKVIVNYRGT